LLSAEFVRELGSGDAELVGEFELKGLTTGRASVCASRLSGWRDTLSDPWNRRKTNVVAPHTSFRAR
jgi:hypothetical protein